MKVGLPILLTILISVQLVCAFLFLLDVISEFPDFLYIDWHFAREAVATAGLFVGIGFEVMFLRDLLRRKAMLEHSVEMASSALQAIIENHFARWKLTPGERDVAHFLVKGLTIAEIAKLRGSAEGTIKAHLNSIYKKANSRSRADLMANIMDSLVDKPLVSAAESGRQTTTIADGASQMTGPH